MNDLATIPSALSSHSVDECDRGLLMNDVVSTEANVQPVNDFNG
jgi:hypothetical protein